MSSSLLPNECLNSFLTFLDNKSLYKCLFVNRYYCKLSIPLIWKDPFMIGVTEHTSKSSLVVNSLLACLNENELSSLIPYTMNLNNRSHLFEYGKFVRKIDHRGCAAKIVAWLKTHGRVPSTQISYEDFRVQKLVNVLYQMIIRQGSLKEFNVCIDSIYIDLPKFSNFTAHQPGIANLKCLRIELDLISGEMKYQNTIEFLGMIPKFCNGIINCNLYINKLSGVFVTPLLDILNSQPLEKVTLNIQEKDGAKEIINALKFQSKPLKRLFFKGLNFQEVDLSIISNLKYLEHLKFVYCNGFKSNHFSTLPEEKSHLKELDLQYIDTITITSDIIISMINSLCNEELLKLSLSIITPEIAKTIKISCQNISYLYIQITSIVGLDKIISIICELSSLKFLHIKANFFDLDDAGLLMRLLCEKLKFVEDLWLDSFIKLHYFEYFTNNCKVHLKKLAIVSNTQATRKDYLKCVDNYQKVHRPLKVLKFSQPTRWEPKLNFTKAESVIIESLITNGVKYIGKIVKAREL